MCKCTAKLRNLIYTVSRNLENATFYNIDGKKNFGQEKSDYKAVEKVIIVDDTCVIISKTEMYLWRNRNVLEEKKVNLKYLEKYLCCFHWRSVVWNNQFCWHTH